VPVRSDGQCLCGVYPSDRGSSWAVEHSVELWGESARLLALDSSL
jgi:hypothetical protein